MTAKKLKPMKPAIHLIAPAFAMPLIQRAAVDALNKQIALLTDARDALLKGMDGSTAPQKKKPTLSAKGRKSIADAQRKRWAEQKRKQRSAAKKSAKRAASPKAAASNAAR